MHPDATPPAELPLSTEDGRRAARLVRLLAVLQKALGHDLPNVLVGVQGLARLLESEEGERLSADGRSYLARVAAGAARAHALVGALAEVARLGKPMPAAEPVDLAELAAGAAAEVEQLALDRNVVYDGPQQPLILFAPRAALRKVLVLLLRRAMTAGPRRVEVSGRVADTAAEVCVADDGPALPPEEIGRLFEPATGPDASALDLFLVRHLAEDWGGSVRVETGGRTAFIVTWPAKTSPP
jgi:signal transduction histidine kinase